MKEATGELNVTVITVIAVASLSAFFYFTIWPLIRANMDSNTKCSQAVCEKCTDASGNCTTDSCHVAGSNENFECVWKG